MDDTFRACVKGDAGLQTGTLTGSDRAGARRASGAEVTSRYPVSSSATPNTPERRGAVTDERGYLLRRREGSDVPVSPGAAAMLGKGLTDREIAILMTVEQLGVASAEQLARAFFNTHRSAYEALLRLAKNRFLANPGVDPLIIRRSVAHLPPPRNPLYVLDWNGAYLLSRRHGYALTNWRADAAAKINGLIGHDLGVSEVWSYLSAAARATQEERARDRGAFPEPFEGVPLAEAGEDGPPLNPGLPGIRDFSLSMALRNEKAALISPGGSTPVERSTGDPEWHAGGRVLLKPDAAFVFEIMQREQAALRPSSDAPEVPSITGTYGATAPARHEPGNLRDYRGMLPAQASEARGSILSGPLHPRWSPSLSSWHPALLAYPPSSEVMLGAEAKPGAQGRVSYRTLLLEMETGSNNDKDTVLKIKGYNRTIRNYSEAWARCYGNSPRVLVVVLTNRQVQREALKWRTHYYYKQETAVLLTSLEILAEAYGRGDTSGAPSAGKAPGSEHRYALISAPCWLDVMVNKWKTLGEALGLARPSGAR